MHHFLLEFITGGGLSGQTLPKCLQNEGELMLQTLLNELLLSDQNTISISRDARLAPLHKHINQIFIPDLSEQYLNPLLNQADCCWLIAPETADSLASLAERFMAFNCLYIGCLPEAIRITGSKIKTINILHDSGISTITTSRLNESIPDSQDGWIIKPNDGVGGEGIRFVKDSEALSMLKAENDTSNLIIQPYLQGEHLSMSLLVYAGEVQLLACNRQYIDMMSGEFILKQIGINECIELKDELFRIARRIVQTIPGLAAYVGVDLIKTDNDIVLLEINPRFTTAYAGISKSLGINMTETILTTFLEKKMPEIKLTDLIPIKISL